MKSISCLSIVVMSTVLLNNINSLCMEQQISNYQKSHISELMNTIKEQLIIQEIERYGIRYMENKLSHGIRGQWAYQDSNKPVLIIKKTFFKPKSKNDQLTKNIFNVISLRKTEHSAQSPETALSKFLCDEIRYYRIKNKPAVLVKAWFTNAKEVQKIINAHKSTMVNNKIDNSRIDNNEGNNVESDSSEESNNSDDSDESDNDVSYKCPCLENINPMPMCTLFAFCFSYLLFFPNPGQ